MSNTTKYAAKGALYLGFAGLIVNGLKQFFEYLDEPDNFKFNWKEFGLWGAGGMVIGAGGGAIIGAIKDSNADEALRDGTNAYLFTVLSQIENSTSPKIERTINRLRASLHNEFSDCLFEYPSFHGSITRGTDIVDSDCDIRLTFTKSIGTIEEMYYSLEDFLDNNFEDKYLVSIRRQKKSLGLFFDIDGEKIKVDVVPMRKVGKNADVYLFVNNDSFNESNSRVKSNPNRQNRHLQLSKREIEIIRILKDWKKTHDVNIGSLYIEFLVKEAFDGRRLSSSLEKRLLYVLEFIRDNIETMRVVDPGNTNNIISNSLSKDEKTEIANKIERMIEEIQKDSRYIIDYFVLSEN